MSSLPASHSTSHSSVMTLWGRCGDFHFWSAIASSGCSKRNVRDRASLSASAPAMRLSATINLRTSSRRNRRSDVAARGDAALGGRIAPVTGVAMRLLYTVDTAQGGDRHRRSDAALAKRQQRVQLLDAMKKE